MSDKCKWGIYRSSKRATLYKSSCDNSGKKGMYFIKPESPTYWEFKYCPFCGHEIEEVKQ